MQNFQRNWEMQCSAGSKAKGVISGVGKGIVGVFTKPIGGAAELVSQTGYGEFRIVKYNSIWNEFILCEAVLDAVFWGFFCCIKTVTVNEVLVIKARLVLFILIAPLHFLWFTNIQNSGKLSGN